MSLQAAVAQPVVSDSRAEAVGSATFAGLTLVDANGDPISFTARSASGFDYAGVPEPSALVMLLLVLAATRRSSGS